MPRRRQGFDPDDRGFTLVELLITIVVMSVLAGIVVFGVSQFRGDSVSVSCKADAKLVRTAASAYELKQGTFPKSEQALVDAGYLTDPPAGVRYTFDSGTKSVQQGPCSL